VTPIYESERTNAQKRGWMGIPAKLNAHSDSFPLVSSNRFRPANVGRGNHEQRITRRK